MTFDPNVPNAGQSPGLFPTQNNTNYARIKTIINADHVFNDTAQDTDGVHKQCTMISRAQPNSLPSGTNGMLYSWLDGSSRSQLRFYNGADDFQITPTLAIRASVNFSNSGAIRSAFNVNSVTKNGTGDYTVNFTEMMPDTTYHVQVTGQRNAVDSVCAGCIRGGSSFSAEAQQGSVRVQFFGSSGTLQSITAGCVTIFSVT